MPLPYWMPLRLRVRLGQARPGDFRIGVGHGGNAARIERRLVSGSDLRGDFGLMAGLVCQHRRTDDIADGKDMRHVGAHLLVDVNDDRAR